MVAHHPSFDPTKTMLRSRFDTIQPEIRERIELSCSTKDGVPEAFVESALEQAYHLFVQLAKNGSLDLAYPTPLARFAARQFRAGRRVGTKANVKDVTSPYAQQSKGLHVERLDRYDAEEEAWKETLVEDRRAGPAQTAAARIDFGQWLANLTPRCRRIAEVLATGEPTTKAAREFGVSPGRISQIRRELKDSWDRFLGETPSCSAIA